MKEISIKENIKLKISDDGMKKNILIIDDEELICELLNELLQSWNYNPLAARHTEEGVLIFDALYKEGFTPDLILLDIKMPAGMKNGFQFADYLKDLYHYERIIYMTALSSEDETRKELQRRKQLFLGKPFNFEKLNEMIESSL